MQAMQQIDAMRRFLAETPPSIAEILVEEPSLDRIRRLREILDANEFGSRGDGLCQIGHVICDEAGVIRTQVVSHATLVDARLLRETETLAGDIAARVLGEPWLRLDGTFIAGSWNHG